MQKNDIRLILTDMDGTLLSPDLTISAANRQAILDARQAGIETAIATGRLDLLVRDYVRQLDLRLPVVSCNGALVRDLASGEIIHQRALSAPAAATLIRLCLEHEVDGLAYTQDAVWHRRDSTRVQFFHAYNRLAAAGGTQPVALRTYDQADPEHIAATGVYKVFLARRAAGDIEHVFARARQQFADLAVTHSVTDALDIMSAAVSKGDALRLLAAHAGLRPEQVAAFGDNDNDISMLQAAGVSFAMGNAKPHVQAAACHVTDSNQADGFARAVYRHLLAGRS